MVLQWNREIFWKWLQRRGITHNYSGHTMSMATSMLLILMFTMPHNVSGNQLNDLLILIGCHCLTSDPGLKGLQSRFQSMSKHIMYVKYIIKMMIMWNLLFETLPLRMQVVTPELIQIPSNVKNQWCNKPTSGPYAGLSRLALYNAWWRKKKCPQMAYIVYYI